MAIRNVVTDGVGPSGAPSWIVTHGFGSLPISAGGAGAGGGGAGTTWGRALAQRYNRAGRRHGRRVK